MENNKFLIISSQTKLWDDYRNICEPFTEDFYAPSIEVAYLLLKKHKFVFALLNDEMYGRIPHLTPSFAIQRYNAGSVYGSPLLEQFKTSYFIFSERENIKQNSNLKYCLYF